MPSPSSAFKRILIMESSTLNGLFYLTEEMWHKMAKVGGVLKPDGIDSHPCSSLAV